MSLNPSGWKPSSPVAAPGDAPATTTGNRALMLEEPLIFEIGDTETTGVDFEAGGAPPEHRLAGLQRTSEIGLPGLTEPETVRH